MTKIIDTISPSAMNVEEVRKMALDVAELVVDHFSTLRNRPVFEHAIPDRPKTISQLSWDQTLSELRRAGSVDPLMNTANIFRKYNIWLHVDAAHGGGLY